MVTADRHVPVNDVIGFIYELILLLFSNHEQVLAEQSSEGEERLFQICEEAELLQLHLPKAGATQVQEHLSSCKREWRRLVNSCARIKQDLDESIGLLKK